MASESRSTDEFDMDACKDEFKPTPEDGFEYVQLGENLTRLAKIGSELSSEVRSMLIECLQENYDLFAFFPYKIIGINPQVYFHQLNLDAGVRYVSQCRRKRSIEKGEATESMVKGLLDSKFISKAKYTEWLSNVVLVKKGSGK